MSQHSRSSGSPDCMPRFRAGFCFMGVSLAASRKQSRARSGFRAPRELCSICSCPQADRSTIRGKCCPSVTRRAVAVAVRDTLKKAENATVGKTKLLIFHDLESAARNFSVFP
jgi:hypothetical protein